LISVDISHKVKIIKMIIDLCLAMGKMIFHIDFNLNVYRESDDSSICDCFEHRCHAICFLLWWQIPYIFRMIEFACFACLSHYWDRSEFLSATNETSYPQITLVNNSNWRLKQFSLYKFWLDPSQICLNLPVFYMASKWRSSRIFV